MSVKTEVLKLLEASRERDLSGQEMAESLGVTRSAIWKAVNTLKKEGYQIQAVNNRAVTTVIFCLNLKVIRFRQ